MITRNLVRAMCNVVSVLLITVYASYWIFCSSEALAFFAANPTRGILVTICILSLSGMFFALGHPPGRVWGAMIQAAEYLGLLHHKKLVDHPIIVLVRIVFCTILPPLIMLSYALFWAAYPNDQWAMFKMRGIWPGYMMFFITLTICSVLWLGRYSSEDLGKQMDRFTKYWKLEEPRDEDE